MESLFKLLQPFSARSSKKLNVHTIARNLPQCRPPRCLLRFLSKTMTGASQMLHCIGDVTRYSHVRDENIRDMHCILFLGHRTDLDGVKGFQIVIDRINASLLQSVFWSFLIDFDVEANLRKWIFVSANYMPIPSKASFTAKKRPKDCASFVSEPDEMNDVVKEELTTCSCLHLCDVCGQRVFPHWSNVTFLFNYCEVKFIIFDSRPALISKVGNKIWGVWRCG